MLSSVYPTPGAISPAVEHPVIKASGHMPAASEISDWQSLLGAAKNTTSAKGPGPIASLRRAAGSKHVLLTEAEATTARLPACAVDG